MGWLHIGQREGAEETFGLSLPVSSLLESPLIQAWKDLGKWNMAAVREAIPLPLDLVRKLEQAFLEVEGESRVILGAILLPASSWKCRPCSTQ